MASCPRDTPPTERPSKVSLILNNPREFMFPGLDNDICFLVFPRTMNRGIMARQNGPVINTMSSPQIRWKHAYCWTHTPTHSVRIIRDVLDRMGDSQRDGTSTIANICKGVAIEDLSREDLVEALTKSIATAAFLHELTLKTPQQQHIKQGLQLDGDKEEVMIIVEGSGGNDQADQGTEHQQSEFQTPPSYTTYQDSFMEGIFGGISHQYGGEHPTFDTSPVTYIGYSLPDSTAASASQVPPEYVE
ncbi:hypothetical protein F511_05516 [Dorcoceras hygrometricum]|uniref:Uncharacterized protein n=1 Tax=Dorcoceras hygrometricum TaxID=472368 RepID=A0A2Z7BAT7_9LAMI|nr:hypothetical protein F511_05516 [Dorcoceras hygrometricum]